MSRRPRTPGVLLFLFLLDRGGSATAWEISRRNQDGRLLPRARKELEGLIVEERFYAAHSKRPIRRITITVRGWAAAQHYRPGWAPQHVPADTVFAELARLQREKDPRAIEIRDALVIAKAQRIHDADVARGARVCRARDWPKLYGAFDCPKDYAEHKERLAVKASARELARREQPGAKLGACVPRAVAPAAASIPSQRADLPAAPRSTTLAEARAASLAGVCPQCAGSLPSHEKWCSCFVSEISAPAVRAYTEQVQPTGPAVQPVQTDDPDRALLIAKGYQHAIVGENRVKFGDQVVSYAEAVRRNHLR